MDKNKKGLTLSIEWHSILRDLIHNFWVIVLAALIGLMGNYILEKVMYSPEYTSSATLVINAKVGNFNAYTNLSVSSEMANVFSELFVQPSMKNEAAKYLGRSSFKGSVSASVLQDTNIVNLSVTTSSPQTSYEEINAVLKVYPIISDKVFGNAVVLVLKNPTVPKSAANTMRNRHKNLFFAACVLATFVAIVVISILRDTVKDESSFKSKIGSKLIATIPHEKKSKGWRDFFIKNKKALLIHESAFISLRFTEAYNKISAKLEYMNRKNGDKIFAVTSVAENEGKSTCASNIAISLASKGNNVILFDFDEKKPALYKIFELQPEDNTELDNLFSGQVAPNDYKFRRYKQTSLFLGVNTTFHRGYQQWFENGTVEKMVNDLKDQADYIIIDTAPLSVDSIVTNIVKFADQTVMVVRTDVVYASSINDAIVTIEEVGGHFAGCIVNDVYPEFSLFGQFGFDEGGYYYSKRYNNYSKYSKYDKYSKYHYYNYANKKIANNDGVIPENTDTNGDKK